MKTKQLAAFALIVGCLVGAFFVIGHGSLGTPAPASAVQATPPEPQRQGQGNRADLPPWLSSPLNPTLPAASPAVAAMGVAAVRGQIAAIHHGDYRKALTYATPSVRQRFGADPQDGFREMILSGYPELTSCTEIHLLHAALPQTDQMILDLIVSGDEMMNVPMRYELRKENGRYLVDGAQRGRPFISRM